MDDGLSCVSCSSLSAVAQQKASLQSLQASASDFSQGHGLGARSEDDHRLRSYLAIAAHPDCDPLIPDKHGRSFVGVPEKLTVAELGQAIAGRRVKQLASRQVSM